MLKRDFRYPTPALIDQCKKCLESHGWCKDLAPDDFERGANGIAIAIENHIGMYVRGTYGSGKTAFLETIADHMRANGREFKLIHLKNPDEADLLNRRLDREATFDLMNYHVILDDLGSECPINEFGTRIEPAMEFIMIYLTVGRGSISISTNLTDEQLLERYGARVDALRENVTYITFKNQGLRTWL